MKVAVFDNNFRRFTGDLLEHWSAKHEVKFEPGLNFQLAHQSDVVFIDQFDHNVHELWHCYTEKNFAREHWNFDGELPEKRFKIYARALDWDVWQGLVRGIELLKWLDGFIVIAPHIQKRVLEETGIEGHLIRCGVSAEKYTFSKERMGHNIIIPCNEIDWVLKGVIEGLKIFSELDESWTLTVKGKWCQQAYFREILFPDLVKKLRIEDRVKFVDQWVEDEDAYLDEFDYCLLPTYKEAFSYVAAKCALKGIKPVLNWWYGAEDIYPKEWLYTKTSQAVEMLKAGNNDPQQYRDFVAKTYPIEKFYKEMDGLMGL